MPDLQLAPKLRLHYQEFNPDGALSVLLLHGLGATGESWGLQIPSLTGAGYRVIVPDARGFGGSTFPGGSSTVAEMAGDMHALLQALRAGPTHLVGISMGGTLALQMALDGSQPTDRPSHPGDARNMGKLVLVNTFASLRPKRLSVWVYFALRMLLVHTVGIATQAETVARRIFPHPEQEPLRQTLIAEIKQADPRGYRAAMRALARFNVVSRLKSLPLPTLVITGEHDTTVPPATQAILARQIPGARQVIIAGAGHAVSVEQAQSFNRILIDFLAEDRG